MPRVKSNVVRLKRKKQIMKAAKGAFGGRSKLWKAAKETVERGWRYAYRDRKNKKRDFRRLWIVRINAAARQHDMSTASSSTACKPPASRSTARSSPTSPCATRRRSRRSPSRCARRVDAARRPPRKRSSARIVARDVVCRAGLHCGRRPSLHPRTALSLRPALVQLSEYLAQADALERDARALLDALDPATRLDVAKGQLNALKDERIAALQGALRALPPEDRRAAGAAFNALKNDDRRRRSTPSPRVSARRDERRRSVDRDDAGAPHAGSGALHPVTLVIDEICDDLPRAGLHRRARPGSGDGVVQLRRAQLPAGPSGDGAARHALPRRRRAAAHAHVAGAGAHAAALRAAGPRALPGQGLPPRLLRRDARAGVRAARRARRRRGHLVRRPQGDARASSRDASSASHAARASARRTSRSPSRRREMDVRVPALRRHGCRVQGHCGWVEILGCGHGASRRARGRGPRQRALHRLGLRHGPGAHRDVSATASPTSALLYDSDVRFLEQFAR